MRTYKEQLIEIIYWSILFFVSTSMFIYGVLKPFQFGDFSNSTPLNLSEGHIRMWEFYGFTKAYPIILGLLEILGALSLLLNKTRMFGCILLTIILSNIILQDYFYEISALSSAIVYQSLVFVVIIYDYKKFKQLIQVLFKSTSQRLPFKYLIIAVLIALVFKYLETKVL